MAEFNLSLTLRKLLGAGTLREWNNRCRAIFLLSVHLATPVGTTLKKYTHHVTKKQQAARGPLMKAIGKIKSRDTAGKMGQ